MPSHNENSLLHDRDQMEKIYSQLLPDFKTKLLDIYQKIRSLTDKHGMAVTIKYRIKHFDDFCEKIRRISRVQGNDLLQITDLLGIKIICPFLEDLETIEQLIAANFDILEMEHRAEQHSFREFGYDSVHLLIRTPDFSAGITLPHSSPVCEIQLRTILQDAWAEVEHELVYKSDIPMPNLSIRRKLASLNASLTLFDLIFQEIRDNQKEIRQRGLRRRQTVETPACNSSGIDISKLPEVSLEEMLPDPNISVAMPHKKLEQLMLSALEAHSNYHFEEAIKLYSLTQKMKLEAKHRSLIYNHRGMAWVALAEYKKGIND